MTGGKGGEATCRDKMTPAEFPSLSVTSKLSELLPAAVGVPLMDPVEGSNDNPLGSEPEVILQTYEPTPPEAAKVAE